MMMEHRFEITPMTFGKFRIIKTDGVNIFDSW